MLLSTLDCSKANGHDNISARMLKATALSITSAVTKLFNISIRLGEIPNEWKMARVSPIPIGERFLQTLRNIDPSHYFLTEQAA